MVHFPPINALSVSRATARRQLAWISLSIARGVLILPILTYILILRPLFHDLIFLWIYLVFLFCNPQAWLYIRDCDLRPLRAACRHSKLWPSPHGRNKPPHRFRICPSPSPPRRTGLCSHPLQRARLFEERPSRFQSRSTMSPNSLLLRMPR